MIRFASLFFLLTVSLVPVHGQEPADPVSAAIAQGDAFASKRKYDLAMESYRKADKLCHHNSAACYLKIAGLERKTGDLPGALDDAKHAIKVAGDDKHTAVEARLFRATLLSQMSSKPSDKKLKEAEDELRQSLALDSSAGILHYDLGFILIKQERDPEGVAEMNAFLAAPGADPATAAEARNIIANPVRARTPFAPSFSFTSLENEKISSEALRGKVVLLDFWATWCPPCRASIPSIKGLQGKYAGKAVQIISISSDSDEQAWRSFVAAQHMNWTEYIDLPRSIQNAFGVDSLPTYVVIDKDGVVRFRQSGFGNETPGEIEEAINKALKRDPDPKLAAAASSASPAPTSGFAASGAEPNPAATTVVREAGTHMVAAHTTAAPAKALGEEPARIAGNVYTYNDLKMTYTFPQSWIGKIPEAASAYGAARVIFYASRNGAGSADQPDLSAIRITVSPEGANGLSMENFQKATSGIVATSGMTLVRPPTEVTVKQRKFLRADLVRNVGAIHLYQSTLQTEASGALLTIDIFAVSADELQQVFDSLQSISIGAGAQ